MSHQLFLDDDPNRAAIAYQRMTKEDREATIWCQTVEEAIITLWDYRDTLTVVSLDHDLNGETYMNVANPLCGMEVVRWLEEKAVKEPAEFDKFKKMEFTIHSWNEYAAPKMFNRLTDLGLKVKYRPFGT